MSTQENLEVSYVPQMDRWWPNAKVLATNDDYVVFIREGRTKPLVRHKDSVMFRTKKVERDEWVENVIDNLDVNAWSANKAVLGMVYDLIKNGKIKSPSN